MKNNVFEFNNQIKQQISGTAIGTPFGIGTKFAPTYVSIFMDNVETDFLEIQRDKPFSWVRYIDGIFFI